jgi:hypothetical protein
MTPRDDSQDEMRGLFLDQGTADRLLAGRVDPDDAPPGYAEVARLLRAAGAPPTATELVREEQAVAAAARAMRARPMPASVPATRRSTVRSRFIRVRVAGLIAVATVLGTGGLAAAGALPDAAQNAASDVLSSIGISVPAADQQPASDEHPASTGTEISKIATTTDATGVDKGAEISSTASGGMSQAGANGSGSGAPVTTPNTGGTGTADTASGGAADTGTATADDASQGHSSAGAGNADGHTPAA